MRKGWVWLLVAACFLLVLGLAGLGLSAAPRPVAPPQRLPDGSTLIPLGITAGTTHHRWTDGGPFQATLSWLWPVGVPYPPGLNVHDYNTTAADTPVLWLRRTRGSSANAYNIARVTTRDSDGCLMQQNSTGETFIDGTGNIYLEAIPIPQFNRREPEIHLQLNSFTTQGLLRQDAEFTLRNPLPTQFPTWTAPPLPVTAADGPLTVTLDQLLTRCDNATPPRPATKPGESWTYLGLHAAENGRRSENWTVADVEARDATGNVVMAGSSTSGADRGEIRYLFLGSLCPREPAWKVRVEMSRSGGFAPGELWTLRNLPLPGLKERKAIGKQTTLQGVRVVCSDFKGPQAPATQEISIGNAYSLQVAAENWHKGLRMTLVNATDQRGRKVESAGSSSSGSGAFSYGLRPLPGSKTVTITLAVHPSRYLDFTAHAGLPSAPAKANQPKQ